MSETVIVANSKATKRVYHTERCQCYPESECERQLQDLDERWTHCKFCSGEGIAHNDQPKPTCPFCGANVGELPAHLPCEESP